jgi:hypothetical protein
MTFRDVEWVAERTNFGDAIGFIGYDLLFALVECALAWAFVLLLNFLLPKQWERQIRIPLLGSIVFVIAIWAILGQVYFLTGTQPPDFFVKFALATGHPLWVLYGMALASITASIAVPMFLLVRYPKIREKIQAIFDRIVVLSGIYLFLDFIGIIIVITRNL